MLDLGLVLEVASLCACLESSCINLTRFFHADVTTFSDRQTCLRWYALLLGMRCYVLGFKRCLR
jgi:hypothetical protein